MALVVHATMAKLAKYFDFSPSPGSEREKGDLAIWNKDGVWDSVNPVLQWDTNYWKECAADCSRQIVTRASKFFIDPLNF